MKETIYSKCCKKLFADKSKKWSIANSEELGGKRIRDWLDIDKKKFDSLLTRYCSYLFCNGDIK